VGFSLFKIFGFSSKFQVGKCMFCPPLRTPMGDMKTDTGPPSFWFSRRNLYCFLYSDHNLDKTSNMRRFSNRLTTGSILANGLRQ